MTTAGGKDPTLDSAAYRERLRQLLPELRQIEGFPIGSDDDILALSDPPYYTACPNPFLGEFIAEHGTPYDEATDDYHREPFAADVSEGKTDGLYRAHGYHTKVPHKAIAPYLLHYTDPGDIVLDGFAGSGMTGVAAQWCGRASQVERDAVENTFRAANRLAPTWGGRVAIVNDLGPAATFIAANYLEQLDATAFARAGKEILDEVERELGWMYETRHSDGQVGRIEYTVWSAVYGCPQCGGEVNFVDEALDAETKRTRDEFPCAGCGTLLTKRRLQKRFTSTLDAVTGESRQVPTRAPVLIHYRVGTRVFEKTPDAEDMAVLAKIAVLPFPPEAPRNAIPHMHMTHERARMEQAGINHVHHFFLPRAVHALAALWRLASATQDQRLRHMLLFFVEQAIWGMSVLNRYQPIQQGRPGGSQVNRQLTGVYYVPAQIAEVSPRYNLGLRLERLSAAFGVMIGARAAFAVSTGDCARIAVPDQSVDYVFTDPPFGENIYYADLNFLVESWHRVWTNAIPEAIVDRAKGKKLVDYQHLIEACFHEYARVLKPGRWMTVVFHNSSNAVWNAIQEAIQRSGFVVADVRTMDKQQGSYRQVTSTAVKQDLVISAYKPQAVLEERFTLEAGTEEGAWDFIRDHLGQLPVFVAHHGRVELVAERQNYLLYDRMIAFHIQRGATVPLSAASFYAGLSQRFPERDDMYFTELQAADYDRQRLEAHEVEQLSVFVIDEKSAIQWIRSELLARHQTFQELQPRFLRELNQTRFEELPELRDMLAESFLEDASSHRWRVPDSGKQADLEAIRIRALLSEFATYLSGTGKLKRFRLEAIRAGFADLWAKREYGAIIRLAERLPDEVVQEDHALLMYYDNAVTREGGRVTSRDHSADRLFMHDEQLELMDRSVEQLELERKDLAAGVDDDARRAAYRERLRQLLPELRQIEGFPIGSDDDILALSDPPYYTACPNPFLGEFIAEHSTPYDEATDDYHREPFAADVSEGKNDPIYNAHSYHTKVPHKAIMRYILHYTQPGDIVFDGFCGTGMTGVAAQLCGSPDPEFKSKIEAEWADAGHEPPRWGARKAILGDLSPAATFIAYNLNNLAESAPAWRAIDHFARALERETFPSLATADTGVPRDRRPRHPNPADQGLAQYTVWSDVVVCPNCGLESTWWSLTFRGRGEELAAAPTCPSCSARLPRNPERATSTRLDPELGAMVRQAKSEPVLINYAVGKRRFDKAPDAEDTRLIAGIESSPTGVDVPVVSLPAGFNTSQPVRSHGYTHVHHFFTRRNLTSLAALWNHARHSRYSERMFGLFVLTSLIQRVFRLNRYMPKHDRHVGPLSGTLYVSAITAEIPVVHYLRDKLDDFAAARAQTYAARAAITTASSTDLRAIPANSVDYLFVDPPFGGNLNYSELNVLYEAWLGVLTANETEAIINDTQGKGLVEYQHLMTRCFNEFFRIVKPGRWVTVEFHNSQNSVWTAIQESLARAGFVIADVRILDKQKGTTKQLSYSNTVKMDLIISAYKPSIDHATSPVLSGSETSLWAFVENHLALLPVAEATPHGRAPVLEREPALLYDRMLAFFVARGASVPLSAPAFYRELRGRYPERDGLVFLPLQAAKWDVLGSASVDAGDEQMPTFIPDEQAAIRYLRRRLAKPAPYQELYPEFTARLHPGVSLAVPELRTILEENFVRDGELWRTPDPEHEDDLRELRERELLREYETYVQASGRIPLVRPDALAAGFSNAWNERRYDEIVSLGNRVPEAVIQEDTRLLMYYDNAQVRRQ